MIRPFLALVLLASPLLAQSGTTPPPLPDVDEARGRARLLHETLHGALQIMHRDFFRPEDKTPIPSAALEDVFKVMAETWKVELHWLGVNARVMDAEHEARDDFEKDAVKVLATGAAEHEAVEADRYRFAGSIQLHNACLKCHVPNRTSLEDRFAGLVISMPVLSKTAEVAAPLPPIAR